MAKNRGFARWDDPITDEAAWREGNVDSPRICIGNAHRIRLNYGESHKATRDSLSQPSRFTSSRVTAVMNYRPFLLHDLCANVLCIRREYSRETAHDNSRWLHYQSILRVITCISCHSPALFPIILWKINRVSIQFVPRFFFFFLFTFRFVKRIYMYIHMQYSSRTRCKEKYNETKYRVSIIDERNWNTIK